MAIDRCGHTVAFEQIWKRCAHHQDWRWTKDVPEGHFHSIIFWNMASNWWGYMNKCNWMVKRCTPPRLIVEQCCTWRIMSYYHLQHGYDFWTILSHSCIWMNIGRMHSPRLTVGPSCFEARRRTSPHEYGWWTSLMMPMLFLLWSDLTSWEESMEKNIELTTMSLLLQGMRSMSGWPDSSKKAGDNIYLKSIVSIGGKFMTGWQSWWVLAWCAQSIRG